MQMRNVIIALSCLVLVGAATAQTLTVWSTGSEDDVQIMNEAARIFIANNPGVTVDIRPLSWDDAHAQILTATVSRSGPDIITGGLSWGIEFGELGGLLDLREVAPDVVEEVEGVVQEGIYQSVVSTDGAVYAVPWDLTVYMMYYLPELLEEVGAASPPQTWEEMTDALTKLQEAGHTGFAMAWGNTQWLGYFNFLEQAGGSLYNEDCSQATVNSPEGVEALRFYADLYTTYNVPTDPVPDLEGGMASGNYAFGYTGNWLIGSLDAGHPELEGRWNVARLPAGPAGRNTAFIGGRVMGVMASSQNPELAAQFIRTVYDPAAIEAMTAKAAEFSITYVPPRVDMVDLIQAPSDRVEALQAQLEDAEGPPNCPGWEESARTLERQIQEVIFNNADPQQALDIAASEMTNNLP